MVLRLAVSIAFAASLLLAQSVEVRPHLKVGDSFTLEIQRVPMYKELLKPEVLLSSVTREIEMYLYPLGFTLKQGETTEEQVRRPMPY